MITNDKTIYRATQFCRMIHGDQIDRDGLPHYAHCERVASKMPTRFLAVCALLHDSLEDTDISHETIRMEFGDSVLQIVKILSQGYEETWKSYIGRVMASPLAMIVKIADIEDNIARADEQFSKKLSMYEETLSLLRYHLNSPNTYVSRT